MGKVAGLSSWTGLSTERRQKRSWRTRRAIALAGLVLIRSKEMNKNLTAVTVRELLHYEPETGIFTWRVRSEKWFTSNLACRLWNKRNANKEALTAVKSGGYRHGSILGVTYRAHRVAWLYHYGFWPSQYIDHVDGDPTNNRINNLRDVTKSQNNRNKRASSRCKSGCNGVTWCKQREKWLANIRIFDKTLNLGRYDDKNDAIAARKAAEIKHGFHPNHGRSDHPE